MPALATRIDEINEQYLELHRRKESAFWETRMGIRDRGEELSRADLELHEFLGDAALLAELRSLRESGGASPDETVVLDGWILTLSRNQVEDAEARRLLRELVAREEEIQRARGRMDLAFVHEGGDREAASSIALGNAVRTDADPARRRAAFAGLRALEDDLLDAGFAEVVRLRNRFARRLGYGDFYDYKVQWAEGFDKKTLFGFLDELERRTREPARRALGDLRRREGDDGLLPWNLSFHAGGGSLQKEKDEYFPFGDAVERWVRTFDALGIRFRGALVTLDLLDRRGKYENGFMHGPGPAFRRRGQWLPAEINFTANAIPRAVGAGFRAAGTLFHEGGHAAHFANIVMDAPCFSQEFAPTSVALSETQSMFCDRLLSDADWKVRYAADASGHVMPFDLIEREIRETQPFRAQGIRNMLVVCYAEKALYETPDAELEPDRIRTLLRDTEVRITQAPGGNSRPTLSVPHLLSRDSSAYYHGYVLAQMAVHQTREHFLKKHGRITDNPAVGEELSRVYWAPGNSRSFLDLVRALTGRDFSADALAGVAEKSPDEVVATARAAVEAIGRVPRADREPDLDLRLRVVHGPEVVVEEGHPPLEVARRFRRWLEERPSDPA